MRYVLLQKWCCTPGDKGLVATVQGALLLLRSGTWLGPSMNANSEQAQIDEF